jgi:hypothetical protein
MNERYAELPALRAKLEAFKLKLDARVRAFAEEQRPPPCITGNWSIEGRANRSVSQASTPEQDRMSDRMEDRRTG